MSELRWIIYNCRGTQLKIIPDCSDCLELSHEGTFVEAVHKTSIAICDEPQDLMTRMLNRYHQTSHIEYHLHHP